MPGSDLILFRTPLIFVAVSRGGLSSGQLTVQLTYIYNQILSVLTAAQLNRIFNQRKNFDLRRMLSGSDGRMYVVTRKSRYTAIASYPHRIISTMMPAHRAKACGRRDLAGARRLHPFIALQQRGIFLSPNLPYRGNRHRRLANVTSPFAGGWPSRK